MLRTAQSRFALVRTLNAPSIQAHNTKPSSIDVGLLPVELLLDIFEQLDRNALLTCMQVCRRWYDIASPYFFAIIPVRYSHCQRFAKHFPTHPELAEYVKDVYFFDRCWGDSGNQPHMEIDSRPFDIQLLASTLPFLTNLRKLFLVGYDNKTDLPLPCVARRQSTPVALQRLTLESCKNIAFILHGLLPLFSVDTLVTDASLYSQFGQQLPLDIDTLFPPASIAIRNLVFRGTQGHFYDFFERALVPGGLRGLGTGGWWRGNLPLLDWFLRSSAAQNLSSISVGSVEALYELLPTASGEPSICAILGAALARCTRLQYVRVGLMHRGHPGDDPLFQPEALSPLIENLPTGLRAFALHVWILVSPGQPSCHTSSIRSLDAVDRLLDPAGEGRRFRHLRRVELHVHYWRDMEGTLRDPSETCERQDIDHDATPLPRLHAAGLLREFQVDDVELGPDRSADVYWPPDI